jgi:hypothetical protein
MATITGVTLTIGAPTPADARNVTVAGTINFDASDVGKSYRLAITMMGEDKAGDEDAVGDDEVSTFRWPGQPVSLPFKVIPATAPGPVTFSESRAIARATLDEDKDGWTTMGVPPTPVPILRADELYARVTLTQTTTVTVGARSGTKSLFA